MTTFVIPDFFSHVERMGLQSDFPALEKLLSKAAVTEKTHDTVYALIDSLLRETKRMPLGVSALMFLAETQKQSQAEQGWFCCASPVVVLPNRDHLDLAQINGFDITDEEAQCFCGEFNDYFKDDGLHFSFQNPNHWYCQAKTGFPVAEASAFMAQGQNIAAHVPQGKEGVMWRKIFNDMQLLLHHSATNRNRASLNKPEINSLWLWGGGALVPEFTVQSQMSLRTTDLFSKGLALRGAASFSTHENLMETDLIIADLESHEWLNWDEEYFMPALQDLKSGKIKKITLYLDMGSSFSVTKMDFLRFWRNGRSL